MSTSTSHPTSSNTAPWKPLFSQHLDRIGGSAAELVLGTVTKTGLPSVRYCIHRGFWSSLAENTHNELSKNPPIYDSDCPVFTTDARMNKVFDIFATGKGKGDLEQSRSGSGGGGPVEAVYWIKDIRVQWRIRGKCWILAANDIEGESAQNSGTVSAKAQVGRYMRPKGDHDSQHQDWSWKREIENQYENLSPVMRGSFKNPPPGKPVNEGADTPGQKLGQKAGHLFDEDVARQNFRVCIITPEQVEQVDLSDPENSKRWIWTLSEEHGGPGGGEQTRPIQEWDMVETWP